MNCARYRALLHTWVAQTAAVMYLANPYAQKLLISETGGQLLVSRKYSLPEMGHIYFEHHRGKNAGYFYGQRGGKRLFGKHQEVVTTCSISTRKMPSCER